MIIIRKSWGITGRSRAVWSCEALPEITFFASSTLSYAKGAKANQLYHHVESCQETVPEALTAFLEGNGFDYERQKPGPPMHPASEVRIFDVLCTIVSFVFYMGNS